MEEKPKFRANSKEKKLYFNGDYIKLNEALLGTEIFYVNKEKDEKGLKLNYDEEDKYFNIKHEAIRINNFLKENKLKNILGIRCYTFPNLSIYLNKLK